MKMHKSCLVILAIGLLAMFSGSAQADLLPIFEYSFPDSYDGTTTTITDLSAAGNDGTMQGTGAYLPDDRPSGFTSGGSISGASGGYGQTNAINLLTNPLIAAHGGYTLDTWFMFEEGELIDYGHLVSHAGTDVLMICGGAISSCVYVDDGSGGYADTYLTGPTIETDRWYHAISQFDTRGNACDANGDLAGTLSLIVDGVIVGPVLITRDTVGDALDRPIGINCSGRTPPYHNVSNGKLFNPRVSLGVVPEPSALVALAGLLAMLFVRRLMRR